MNDYPENNPDNADDSIEEPSEPAPMSRNFYIVMALIAFLVFLILFINIPGTKSSAATSLTQNNWTAQSYSDASGILVPVQNGSFITAKFDPSGSVTGYSGCNHYFASYTVKDHSLSVTTPGTTEMYCSSPGVMNMESAYISDLVNSTNIRIRSNELFLYDAKGKPRIIFNQSAA
jgi:heat shock protein HslJ